MRILRQTDRVALWGILSLMILLAVWLGKPNPAPVKSFVPYTSWINVNSASQETLESLPGIGRVLALRIINRRETEGAFGALEELMEIPGIGAVSIEKLRPWVTFDQ